MSSRLGPGHDHPGHADDLSRRSNGSVFSPANPNKNFKGYGHIRNALGNSLNIPPSRRRRRSASMPSSSIGQGASASRRCTGYYGPAIAIGGVDLTPLDLTYAYSVLANNGVMNGAGDASARRSADERAIDPVSILKVTDAQRSSSVYDVEPSAGAPSASCRGRARLHGHEHPHRPERPVSDLRLRRHLACRARRRR